MLKLRANEVVCFQRSAKADKSNNKLQYEVRAVWREGGWLCVTATVQPALKKLAVRHEKVTNAFEIKLRKRKGRRVARATLSISINAL